MFICIGSSSSSHRLKPQKEKHDKSRNTHLLIVCFKSLKSFSLSLFGSCYTEVAVAFETQYQQRKHNFNLGERYKQEIWSNYFFLSQVIITMI